MVAPGLGALPLLQPLLLPALLPPESGAAGAQPPPPPRLPSLVPNWTPTYNMSESTIVMPW
jgi:hypothetical protein